MVKRKLVISKTPAKAKSTGSNKISGVKIKNILEHVSTEDFMKFNAQDDKAVSPLNVKTLVTSAKVTKAKGISKKDKMLFKKQRLLQKFDTMSADLKNRLSKKGKRILKLNDIPKDIPINSQIMENMKEPQENKTNNNLKKPKIIKPEKAVCLKIPKPEKSARNTTIFKKAKNNSNKNRQRNFAKGLKAYKKQLKKGEFVENPIKAISERVSVYAKKETAV